MGFFGREIFSLDPAVNGPRKGRTKEEKDCSNKIHHIFRDQASGKRAIESLTRGRKQGSKG